MVTEHEWGAKRHNVKGWYEAGLLDRKIADSFREKWT